MGVPAAGLPKDQLGVSEGQPRPFRFTTVVHNDEEFRSCRLDRLT